MFYVISFSFPRFIFFIVVNLIHTYSKNILNIIDRFKGKVKIPLSPSPPQILVNILSTIWIHFVFTYMRLSHYTCCSYNFFH